MNRSDGNSGTLERMVVLVKEAGRSGGRGFAVQELTSDLARCSVEAHFDD